MSLTMPQLIPLRRHHTNPAFQSSYSTLLTNPSTRLTIHLR